MFFSTAWFFVPWSVIALVNNHVFPALSGELNKIISPGPGMWGLLSASVILFYAGSRELKISFINTLFPFFVAALLLMAVYWGFFDQLSLVIEFRVRQEEFFRELTAHIRLTIITTVTASILGVFFGVLAWKLKKTGSIVFFLANSVQAIPSLALFSILILPLAILTARFPFLRDLGIKGIGAAPALIALILYALLPIIRNTYAGLAAVNQSVREAGIGMGMGKYRLLISVELPIGIPVIVRGIRTSMVQAIGTITVATLINAGGLGLFIFQGMSQAAPDLVIMGVIPIVMLAIIADKGMTLLEDLLTPRGLRREKT